MLIKLRFKTHADSFPVQSEQINVPDDFTGWNYDSQAAYLYSVRPWWVDWTIQLA